MADDFDELVRMLRDAELAACLPNFNYVPGRIHNIDITGVMEIEGDWPYLVIKDDPIG